MRELFTRWIARGPCGLLGMLALVVAIEWGVGRRGAWFMTAHERDWEAAGRLARGSVNHAEVLCFGDSMLKFGVAPLVLEQRLKRSTYCLALLDGKPAASFFLLRRAIEAGARPRLILVDYQPECLFQDAASLSINRHWKALLDAREALDYAWNYSDPDFLGRMLLARRLPSYRDRAEIRANVLQALQGRESPNPIENAKVGLNRRRNQGGLLLPPQPNFHGEVNPAFAASLYTTDWFQRPENASYVDRFMSLAEEHQILVAWVVPPNAPEVERERERIGLRERYDAFAASVQRRHANVVVIDARRSEYPARVFVDPVHLDRNGAAALSVAVAEAVAPLMDERRAAPEGTRWVRLPPFREAAPGLALEDMDGTLDRLAAAGRAGKAHR